MSLALVHLTLQPGTSMAAAARNGLGQRKRSCCLLWAACSPATKVLEPLATGLNLVASNSAIQQFALAELLNRANGRGMRFSAHLGDSLRLEVHPRDLMFIRRPSILWLPDRRLGLILKYPKCEAARLCRDSYTDFREKPFHALRCIRVQGRAGTTTEPTAPLRGPRRALWGKSASKPPRSLATAPRCVACRRGRTGGSGYATPAAR